MPRVTNACQHLQDALELFMKVTGEAVGASFTWSGQVRVFWKNSYRDFAARQTGNLALIDFLSSTSWKKLIVIPN